MNFLGKLFAKFKPKKKADPDALYRFLREGDPAKKLELLKEASRMATEEQRKIYYGEAGQGKAKI